MSVEEKYHRPFRKGWECGLDSQGNSRGRGRIWNWPVKGGHNLDLQEAAVKASQAEKSQGAAACSQAG